MQKGRAESSTYVLAMMAVNVEPVISYRMMFNPTR